MAPPQRPRCVQKIDSLHVPTDMPGIQPLRQWRQVDLRFPFPVHLGDVEEPGAYGGRSRDAKRTVLSAEEKARHEGRLILVSRCDLVNHLKALRLPPSEQGPRTLPHSRPPQHPLRMY